MGAVIVSISRIFRVVRLDLVGILSDSLCKLSLKLSEMKVME